MARLLAPSSCSQGHRTSAIEKPRDSPPALTPSISALPGGFELHIVETLEMDAGDREALRPHLTLTLLRDALRDGAAYRGAVRDLADEYVDRAARASPLPQGPRVILDSLANQRDEKGASGEPWPREKREAWLAQRAHDGTQTPSPVGLHTDPLTRAIGFARAWGFCGGRRQGTIAGLLLQELGDHLDGRSSVAVAYSVPDASSPRGVYISAKSSALRLRGMAYIASDVEGRCRECGEVLKERRRRLPREMDHSVRVRYCVPHEPALGSSEDKAIERAVKAVLDDLSSAFAWSSKRVARIEERIMVPVPKS